MPSPWLIVGFLLALAGAGLAGELHGHKWGIDQQAKADQIQFDKVNAEIAANKAQAAALLNEANARVVQTLTERDELKNRLEAQNAQARKATDDLAAQLRGMRLRFAAQDTGSGAGSSSPASASPDSAGSPGPAIIQLPDEIAANLRQLAFEADQLKDAYATCYGWVTQVH